MKKRKIILTAAAVLVILAVAFLLSGTGKSKQVTMLETGRPERGKIALTVTSTGTVQPVNTVSVGSQVSGIIKKLYVDYNSVVKKGQLLAELDKSLFEAALSQASSNHEQAESQVAYQEANFSRESQLYKIGAISKAEYDNAVYTYKAAKAQASASAAQVQTARKNLSFTDIYSPIDGTILSRSVSEGQTVAASFNTPTIFSIANDLKEMQVEASVDEADIGNVKEGDRVTFTVDAFVNDVFSGTVQQVRLNPTTTSNVVTYTTIINSPNNDLKLKPGMTASITIFTKEADNVLTIPVKAIKFEPDSSITASYQLTYAHRKPASDEAAVWVKKGTQLTQTLVKTGINDNTRVEVLGGLNENDEVITSAVRVSRKEAAGAKQQASPFMPRRPGSSRKGK